VPSSLCRARQPPCAAGGGDGNGDGERYGRLEVQVHGWHACSHARARMCVLSVLGGSGASCRQLLEAQTLRTAPCVMQVVRRNEGSRIERPTYDQAPNIQRIQARHENRSRRGVRCTEANSSLWQQTR